MRRATPHADYPIPTAANVAIVSLQLAAVAACCLVAARATAWWHLALLAAAFAVVGNSIYATLHEAEHGMLHPRRAVNESLGALLALFFPAPFHLIRQGHIGHHLRNRSDDEAFDFYFDGEHPVWKYLQLYGVLTGLFWVMVVLSNVVVLVFPFVLNKDLFKFDRPTAAFMDTLNKGYNHLIRLEALAAIALHASLIYFLDIPLLNYAVMYAGFGFTWSAMQYVHHFGTERDVLNGARNLKLFAPIDWAWLHHNWHHTHHNHPTVPWIYLKKLAKDRNPKADEERGFLPWHYLKMWKGPRYTTDHVENRYAGKIIQ